MIDVLTIIDHYEWDPPYQFTVIWMAHLTMMLSKDDVRDRAVKSCGKQLMVTNAECSPESRQLLSSLYGYTSVMV